MAEENSQVQRQRPRKKARRSDVYEHFTCFTDAHGNDKARCKNCDLELGANTKNGTSNLRTHIKICKARDAESLTTSSLLPQPQPETQLLPSGPGSESTTAREPAGFAEEATRDLARMIALHGYDPSFVEDDYFRSFVRRLNPEFEVPSRVAIEEMCDGIFDEAREDGISRLLGSQGQVSLAIGEAQTTEGEVSYTACRYIDDDWNLHELIIDVFIIRPDSGYCHGPMSGLRETTPFIYDFNDVSPVGVVRKRVLDRLFMMARGGKGKHILLQGLEDDIEKNVCEPHKARGGLCATYLDHVLHSLAQYFTICYYDITDLYEEVEKLYLTRQKRQQLLSDLGLHQICTYNQLWYSQYCSLQVLLKERSNYVLARSSDGFQQLLCKVWGEIHRAIRTVSASSRPTSNLCLAELFRLRGILQSQLARASADSADLYLIALSLFRGGDDVIDVLSGAMDTLDDAIKDSYMVWSIPLALDPRYKLDHIQSMFKTAFGSEEANYYVSDVKRKIKEMYTHYVEHDGTGVTTTNSRHAPIAGPYEHCHSQLHNQLVEGKTELDNYLEDSRFPQTKDFDILNWWKSYGSVQYPTVARMARDALAMPTSSKLSSEQIAHIKSIVRGYSKKGLDCSGDLMIYNDSVGNRWAIY